MTPTFEEFAEALKNSAQVMTENQRQTIRSYIEPICDSIAEELERLESGEPTLGNGVELVERFMREYPECKAMVVAAFIGMLLQVTDEAI